MSTQFLEIGECIVLRSKKGSKLLTLSRDQIGYRYYKVSKRGGVGRKRTRCTEREARALIGKTIWLIFRDQLAEEVAK